MANVEIYALCDPFTGVPRYVGKSTNAHRRYKEHIKELRRQTRLYGWLRNLGQAPTLRILERCLDRDWQERERKWIALGCDLLNMTPGGDAPFCSPEQRTKNGHRLWAQMQSLPPNMKELKRLKHLIGTALRGKYMTQEAKERIYPRLRRLAEIYPKYFGCWAQL